MSIAICRNFDSCVTMARSYNMNGLFNCIEKYWWKTTWSPFFQFLQKLFFSFWSGTVLLQQCLYNRGQNWTECVQSFWGLGKPLDAGNSIKSKWPSRFQKSRMPNIEYLESLLGNRYSSSEFFKFDRSAFVIVLLWLASETITRFGFFTGRLSVWVIKKKPFDLNLLRITDNFSGARGPSNRTDVGPSREIFIFFWLFVFYSTLSWSVQKISA